MRRVINIDPCTGKVPNACIFSNEVDPSSDDKYEHVSRDLMPIILPT
jgi:hypothetical protein